MTGFIEKNPQDNVHSCINRCYRIFFSTIKILNSNII